MFRRLASFYPNLRQYLLELVCIFEVNAVSWLGLVVAVFIGVA